jgi:hypothetical protein
VHRALRTPPFPVSSLLACLSRASWALATGRSDSLGVRLPCASGSELRELWPTPDSGKAGATSDGLAWDRAVPSSEILALAVLWPVLLTCESDSDSDSDSESAAVPHAAGGCSLGPVPVLCVVPSVLLVCSCVVSSLFPLSLPQSCGSCGSCVHSVVGVWRPQPGSLAERHRGKATGKGHKHLATGHRSEANRVQWDREEMK